MDRRDMIKLGAAGVAGLGMPASARGSSDGNFSSQELSKAPIASKMVRKKMTGKKALLEQMKADGITHIFGNPGSTEHGLLFELKNYPDIRYVLGLHEGICVSMADGYARLTQRPAIVQLHVTPGLGNAIGLLDNAKDTQSPMVVLAGVNAQKAIYQEPQLWGPLVAMAQPVCKWAYEIRSAQEITQVFRRAMKIANTPPFGPVFLSLPIDILDATAEMEVQPTKYISWGTAPDVKAIEKAAALLLAAKHPMILVGDAITLSGANEELVRLVEATGAEVFEIGNQAYINMPFAHEQFSGSNAFLFQNSTQERLKGCDLLLAIGGEQFRFTYPNPMQPVVPKDCRVVQIQPVAHELGKNIVPDLAILSDPKTAIKQLTALLAKHGDDQFKMTVRERISRLRKKKKKLRDAYKASTSENWTKSPINGARLMNELAQVLPKNATVFSQSLSNAAHVGQNLPSVNPWQLIRAGGKALGLGLPVPLGMALAKPDRKMIGICSDGSAMYSIQALWTAAHLNLPVTFIILNNGAYHVLRLAVMQYYDLPKIEAEKMQGTDLAPPPLNFKTLAEASGIKAWRVNNPEKLSSILKEAIAYQGPSLVDVVMDAPMENFGT